MKSSHHDHASPFRPRKVRRAPVLRRRGFRPRLEALEGRAVPSTLTVTNNLDSGAGSLRAAIKSAGSGDTIVFDPSLNGQTIALTSDELAIKKTVDIEGPGADKLAVSGSDKFRVFDIVNQGLTVTIAGLTITHGQTQSGQGGGGILNMGSSLTLADDLLSDNEALNAVAQGGAVANHNGATLTATDCAFVGNQAIASTPGGLGFGGAIFNSSFDNRIGATAAISGCTFLANRAVGGDGGIVSGFFNNGSASGGGIMNETAGTLTVAHSTFTGDQAIAGSGGSGGKFAGLCVVDVALGGGINSADGTTLAVSGSIFSDNLAVGGSHASGSTGGPGRVGNGAGGGLANLGAATVTNSTFSHNRAQGGSDNSGGSGPTLVGRGSGGGISSNAFGGSPASLTVSGCTFTDNQAVGGAGTFAGDGVGGGIANFFGSTATASNNTFTGNQALGGTGDSGAVGGNGFGGGIYNDGQSTLTILTLTISDDQADGGSAGTGGSAGLGEGGGLYLADGGVACLDTFTQAHTTNNHATTDHDNIFGSFTTC